MMSSSYRGDVWAWRLDGGTAMSDVVLNSYTARHTLSDGYGAHRQQHNLAYNSTNQQHSDYALREHWITI